MSSYGRQGSCQQGPLTSIWTGQQLLPSSLQFTTRMRLYVPPQAATPEATRGVT